MNELTKQKAEEYSDIVADVIWWYNGFICSNDRNNDCVPDLRKLEDMKCFFDDYTLQK